jgi:hypothetical protein
MSKLATVKLELGLAKGVSMTYSRSPRKDDNGNVVMQDVEQPDKSYAEEPVMSDWYHFSGKGMVKGVICHHEVFDVLPTSDRLFIKEGVNDDGEEYISISEFGEHTMTGSI